VKGICAASFFADAGHEVGTTLMPSLLTKTLGASAAALGLIEGLSDGLAGAARLAGGAVAADPERRRRQAVGGYAITAVLTAPIGVAATVWQVGVLRAGAWAARGLRVPARNALLFDLVHQKHFGRASGVERAADAAGAVVGPLLALVFVTLVGIRAAIVLSVVPGLLAAAAIVYAIRHTKRPEAAERVPLSLRLREVLRGRFGRLMVGIGAFEVGNMAATLLILRATELLEPGRSTTRAVQLATALYVLYNLAAMLASFPAGAIADRIGMVRVLAGGIAFFALAYLGFATTSASIPSLAGCFAAAGIAIGCVETAQHGAVGMHAEPSLRAQSFGVLAGAQAGGQFIASTVAGVLWSAISPEAAMLYAAGCMVLSLLALLVWGRP
jgi:MFS family permease